MGSFNVSHLFILLIILVPIALVVWLTRWLIKKNSNTPFSTTKWIAIAISVGIVIFGISISIQKIKTSSSQQASTKSSSPTQESAVNVTIQKPASIIAQWRCNDTSPDGTLSKSSVSFNADGNYLWSDGQMDLPGTYTMNNRNVTVNFSGRFSGKKMELVITELSAKSLDFISTFNGIRRSSKCMS